MSSDSTAEVQGTPVTAQSTPAAEPPHEGLSALIEKGGGDLSKIVAKLFDENHKLRNDRRELRSKLPKDGSVVLDADAAKAWAAYTALGKADEIQTRLTERDQFHNELSGLRRAETHRTVAEVTKFNGKVLSDLLTRSGLDVEVRDVPDPKAGGKPAPTAFVKHDGKDVALTAYAEEHWKDYLPALKPAAVPANEARRLGTPPSGGHQGSVPPPINNAAAAGPKRKMFGI